MRIYRYDALLLTVSCLHDFFLQYFTVFAERAALP